MNLKQEHWISLNFFSKFELIVNQKYPFAVDVEDEYLYEGGGKKTDDRSIEALRGLMVGFVFTLQSPDSSAQ